MAGTAEGFTSTEQPGYQREDDRAALVLFWLTGIASVGVLGIVCLMLANSGAGGGAAGPHVSPLFASTPWHGGLWSMIRNPGSSVRETADVLPTSLNTKERPSAVAAMAKQQQELQGYNYPVCYSPTCVFVGKRLRSILNPLVDPCDNFNEHICGRYEGDSGSTMEDYYRALQSDLVRGINILAASTLPLKSAKLEACEHCGKAVLPGILQGKLNESYEALLTLHVRLSFVYRLGGLFYITPSVKPGELQILLDTSTVPGQAQFLRSLRTRARQYLQDLASIVKIQPIALPMLQHALNLNSQVRTVLVSAIGSRPDYLQLPVDFKTTTAANVSIQGLHPKFFSDALASHTPYGARHRSGSRPADGG
ncbi:hypothetical protein MTO96_023653 [Rhipicephalus appendiculatus]